MTVIISGDNGVSDVDGSAGTPAIRGTDANTGIFFGSDVIGFSEGGTECARFNADAQFVAAAGTASLPVITTTGDTNTGIFFPAADTIAFAEGGAEAMRIDSSGNVGIGTTSPNNRLHVLGGTDTRLRVEESGGTFFDGVITNAGHFFDSTGTGDLTFNKIGSANMVFKTNNTERMRIDSSGNVNIATTGDTAARLVINGADNHVINTIRNGTGVSTHIAFRNGNGSVGTIQTSGTSTSYNTSSDYRLKENIAPMTGALATVAQLKPCTYTWKTDGSAGQGFIAHELQKVVPYAVTGKKDGEEMQGVDYGKLTPILTAALQEAIAKIETLEARIAVLEAK